jgi:hypothetical protein
VVTIRKEIVVPAKEIPVAVEGKSQVNPGLGWISAVLGADCHGDNRISFSDLSLCFICIQKHEI